MVIVVRCLKLRISVEQTLTGCHRIPGKVPGAEDTKIIKTRSLPSRISQSNGETHTYEQSMISTVMRFSTDRTRTLGGVLPVRFGGRWLGEREKRLHLS